MQLIIYSVPKELQIYTYINIVNFCVFLYLCSRKFYLFYSFPPPSILQKISLSIPIFSHIFAPEIKR